MRSGFIYVLRNEEMKELIVKVGKTIRSADERAKELARATGVAGKFQVLFKEYVADVDRAESIVHDELASYRLQANREFFRVPYELAIRAVIRSCREVNKDVTTLKNAKHVRLAMNGKPGSDAKRLQALLAPYRGGGVLVVLTYENATAGCEVTLGDAWRVRLDPRLLAELQAWLGEDAVLVSANDDVRPPIEF